MSDRSGSTQSMASDLISAYHQLQAVTMPTPWTERLKGVATPMTRPNARNVSPTPSSEHQHQQPRPKAPVPHPQTSLLGQHQHTPSSARVVLHYPNSATSTRPATSSCSPQRDVPVPAPIRRGSKHRSPSPPTNVAAEPPQPRRAPNEVVVSQACGRLFEDANMRSVKHALRVAEHGKALEDELKKGVNAKTPRLGRSQVPRVAQYSDTKQTREMRLHQIKEQLWEQQDATFQPHISDSAHAVDVEAVRQRNEERKRKVQLERQRAMMPDPNTRLTSARTDSIVDRKIEFSRPFVERQTIYQSRSTQQSEIAKSNANKGYGAHFVKSDKETLDDVCIRYGCSYEELLDLNPTLKQSTKLFRRQMLLVPRASGNTNQNSSASRSTSQQPTHSERSRSATTHGDEIDSQQQHDGDQHDVDSNHADPWADRRPSAREQAETMSRLASRHSVSSRSVTPATMAEAEEEEVQTTRLVVRGASRHLLEPRSGALSTRSLRDFEESRQKKIEAEMRELTFQPHVDPHSAELAKDRATKPRRMRTRSPTAREKELQTKCTFAPAINRSRSVTSMHPWEVNGLEQHKLRLQQAQRNRTIAQSKCMPRNQDMNRTITSDGRVRTRVEPFQGVVEHTRRTEEHRRAVLSALEHEAYGSHTQSYMPVTSVVPHMRGLVERSLEWDRSEL
eukprot:PhM_4_TR6470/c0_g1_i1/m.34328